MKLDLVNEFTMRAASLEVEEFLGLTRLLNVPLTTDARDHRPFEDVFIDTVAAYGKLGRSQKRDSVGNVLRLTNTWPQRIGNFILPVADPRHARVD